MNRKSYQVAFSVTRIVVMVALLSTIFFASVNLSLAASAKKKATAVAGTAVSHTEAQIKQLQGALNITGAQKGLWDNLTTVMRENAKDMDALFTTARAEKTQTRNAVEQMRFHSQITEAQLAQLNKFILPFEALYSSMSDEQKQSTDTIFRTGKYGKSKRK